MDLMKYLARVRDGRPAKQSGITQLFPSGPAYATGAETRAAIIAESTKTANDAGGRPLPLAANWHPYTYPLSVQLAKIDDGYPLLPFVHRESRTMTVSNFIATGLFKGNADALEDLEAAGLPLSIQTTQWDGEFYTNSAYTSLSDADTAQTVTSSGRTSFVSPMGTTTAWATLGASWADNDVMAHLQTEYPEPPRVVLLSNNEASRLVHGAAASDTRYVSTYGTTTQAEKSEHFHFRLIDRWNAAFDAFNAELTAEWQAAALHVGYEAFVTQRFRSVDFWWTFKDAPVSEDFDRLMWEPYAWNGGSPEVYDNYWQWDNAIYPRSCKATFLMWSPQNDSMVYAMARDIAYSVDPNYWFEISLWDGELWSGSEYAGGQKAAKYAELNIDPTPDYYKGWAQYCVWITKPRCVREFRKHVWDNATAIDITDPDTYGPYWDAVIDICAHVHQHPTLRRFWRDGVPVENTALIGSAAHPYQQPTTSADTSMTGAVWANYPKNYHLSTNLDNSYASPYPVAWWRVDQNIEYPVYTMAHVIGTTPNREWLVYAHSTGIEGTTLTDVEVTIPDYQAITLPTVPVQGAFYLVVE